MVMLQGDEENSLMKPGDDWEKQKSLKASGGRTDTKSGGAITPSRKMSYCIFASTSIRYNSRFWLSDCTYIQRG